MFLRRTATQGCITGANEECGRNLSFKLMLMSICILLPLHVEFTCIIWSRSACCCRYFKHFAQHSGTLVYLCDKPHFSEIFPSGSQPEIISTLALPPGASNQYEAVVWSVASCDPRKAASDSLLVAPGATKLATFFKLTRQQHEGLDSEDCIALASTANLLFPGFVFRSVQLRGEDFGTSGQHHQTSAGRDRSQDLGSGQRIHEGQVQGNICTHRHLVLRTCQKNT